MENLKVFENDINRLTYFESDDYVNPHVSCLEDGSKVVFCNGVTITAKAIAATMLPIIYKASSTFDKPDKTVLLKANEVTTVTIERPYIYSPGLYTEGLTLGGGESNTAVTEIAIDGTLISPENAFRGCSGLTSIDLTKTNTYVSGISAIMALDNPSMDNMFSGCTNITSLDVSNLDTRYMTGMDSMFSFCSKITSLDLSNFDTGRVQDMGAMFWGCTKLNSINLSSFDTSKVTALNVMFSNCSSLTSIDLSSFDTSKVTNMDYMFQHCSSLTSLDLSNFDTSNVKSMYAMFRGCTNLKKLNLGTFDMGKVTSRTEMFNGINPKVEITLAADSPSLTNIQTQLVTDGVTGAKIHFNGKTYYYDTATKAWKGA